MAFHNKSSCQRKNVMGVVAALWKQGKRVEAVTCLENERSKWDRTAYAWLLQECGKSKRFLEGQQINQRLVKKGYGRDMFLANHLIAMYGRCGHVVDASIVFEKMHKRNVISWNCILEACVESGHFNEVIELFLGLQNEDLIPDKIIFMTILKGLNDSEELGKGRFFHAHILCHKFESDVVVATSLINMYGRLCSIIDAVVTFDSMLEVDLVSWNTMITAYGQNGYSKEAIVSFQRMQQAGMTPDTFTFVSILDACATLCAPREGKWIHGYVIVYGLENNVVVGTALVNMYGKTGNISKACKVFINMPERNVVSWNAMMASSSQNGHSEKAFQLLQRMLCDGIMPNGSTFISILSACRHGGLVDEGSHYFGSMVEDYGITPAEEHYGSMIDLLGRVGWLDQALQLITMMPFSPDIGDLEVLCWQLQKL